MNVQAAINAGLFVEFVYENWQSAGQTTSLDGMPVVTSAGLPVIAGKSYKVIKTIYANDLATSIDPNRPLLEGYKTIGIVAANTLDPNDVFLAVRGTASIWEWLQDFKFLPIPFPYVPGGGLTEDGFTAMYESFSFTPSSSANGFLKDLVALLPASALVTVTGHSLGAAIATLAAFDMSANSPLTTALYTLASPRVGDLSFMHLFNHIVPNAYRVHNRLDIVTKTPPPLLYFHVGDDTELVPGPDMKFDLGCEHSIKSYFNMLAALIQLPSYPIPDGCLKNGPVGVNHTEV